MISFKKLRTTCCFALVITILSLLKLSFFAHHSVGFSYAHCIAPLVGLFVGAPGALLLFCIRSVIQAFTHTSWYGMLKICYVPTLAAAGYLSLLSPQYSISLTKRLVYACIPLSCIILFCASTYPTNASLYSLFWFIPLATLCIPHTNLFFHMLGSTFTAHAVGSILWLYFGPIMTPDMWISLIPIVMLERLIFACGMMMSYTMIMNLLASNFIAPFRRSLDVGERDTADAAQTLSTSQKA